MKTSRMVAAAVLLWLAMSGTGPGESGQGGSTGSSGTGASRWAELPAPPTVPGTPAVVIVDVENQTADPDLTKIAIRWADNSPDETGFKVERQTSGGAWEAFQTVAANVTEVLDTAYANRRYRYRISAFRESDGVIVYSAWSSIMTYQAPILRRFERRSASISEPKIGFPAFQTTPPQADLTVRYLEKKTYIEQNFSGTEEALGDDPHTFTLNGIYERQMTYNRPTRLALYSGSSTLEITGGQPDENEDGSRSDSATLTTGYNQDGSSFELWTGEGTVGFVPFDEWDAWLMDAVIDDPPELTAVKQRYTFTNVDDPDPNVEITGNGIREETLAVEYSNKDFAADVHGRLPASGEWISGSAGTPIPIGSKSFFFWQGGFYYGQDRTEFRFTSYPCEDYMLKWVVLFTLGDDPRTSNLVETAEPVVASTGSATLGTITDPAQIDPFTLVPGTVASQDIVAQAGTYSLVFPPRLRLYDSTSPDHGIAWYWALDDKEKKGPGGRIWPLEAVGTTGFVLDRPPVAGAKYKLSWSGDSFIVRRGTEDIASGREFTAAELASGAAFVMTIEPNAQIGDTVRVEMKGTDAQGKRLGEDTVKITYGHAPVEIEFEALQGNTPLDENRNPSTGDLMHGGGSRIFPDRKTPTDEVPRNKVRVKARAKPGIAPGTPVYLRVFDVDDPTPAGPGTSDPTHIIDSNDDDTYQHGEDNNGVDWLGNRVPALFAENQSEQLIAKVGPNGEIVTVSGQPIDLVVTMQPGDNFRVAGAFTQAELNVLHIHSPQESGYLPPGEEKAQDFTGGVSPMLTVWRRLWIESDSMGMIPANQRWTLGQVDSPTVGVGGNGKFEVSTLLRYEDGEQFDPDEFEGGSLSFYLSDGNGNISGTIGPLKVKSSSSSSLSARAFFEVHPPLSNEQKAQITTAPLTQVKVSDDDNYALLDQPQYLDGGTILYGALAPAYIEPLKADDYNQRKLFPYYRHLKNDQVLGSSLLDVNITATRDIRSEDDCWATLVVACFEPSPSIGNASDGDPDGNGDAAQGATPGNFPANDQGGGSLLGVSSSHYWFTLPGSNDSAIFLETLRDRNFNQSPKADLDVIVSHEIGHTAGFGLNHTPEDSDDLMTPQPISIDPRFRAEDIQYIRSLSKW